MTYSIEDYAAMIADPVRGAAYLSAVREVVTPGCVVADIGAGPGALGVYAAVLGARRVFLIEPDASVNAAVELARENGVSERVEIIRGLSTDITLPEPADVIISDLRGVLPLFGHHLRAAADFRARHLAPGGVCIPRRDTMHAAIVEDAEFHERMVSTWSALPAPMSHASLDALLVNRWFRASGATARLLTDPHHWVTLDYDAPPPELSRRWTSATRSSGLAHGILCWFDAELTDNVRMSNSPEASRALYGQAFFPFASPVRVETGAEVSWSLRAVLSGDDYQWSWSVRAGGGEASEYASLRGIPLSAETLARRHADHTPTLGPDALVLRHLLSRVDGDTSLAELAACLHDRFPRRFVTIPEALAFVARHEELWQP